MTVLDIRFSDWIQKGVTLFLDNALLLIMSSLVALALSAVTFGVLTGPMLAGMAIIIANLQNDRLAPPTVNDLFKGFDYFVATIPVILAFYALAFLGFMLHFIPGPGFVLNAVVVSVGTATIVMAVFHHVDRGISTRDSLKVWWEVFKMNWGPLLGFYILLAIIGGIGFWIFMVGLVVSVPVYLSILGVSYKAIQQQSAAV